MLLADLIAPTRRLALVGLAKNTGKTVTLTALLEELKARGATVGVTSIGRDGERRDVIDSRIEKPRVRLQAGSLVATTGDLLRASGLEYELLEKTDARTPLGRVAIARLGQSGEIEVAGPNAAQDVRAVSEAMRAHGAEQVLIDGAVDRRAASSPEVANGLVISTGAILSPDIEEVVARTANAVALVRLPIVPHDTAEGRRVRELASAQDPGISLLVDESLQAYPCPPRFALAAPPIMDDFLSSGVPPRWLLVSGALPEGFVHSLVSFARRSRAQMTVVVADPTKVFLSEHGPDWYRRQGIALEVLRSIDLRALTVNPIAPQAHRFDSHELREALEAAIEGVPIFDVLDPSYAPEHGAGAT
jgi:hypothetical protein